jgi:hypothetical protein
MAESRGGRYGLFPLETHHGFRGGREAGVDLRIWGLFGGHGHSRPPVRKTSSVLWHFHLWLCCFSIETTSAPGVLRRATRVLGRGRSGLRCGRRFRANPDGPVPNRESAPAGRGRRPARLLQDPSTHTGHQRRRHIRSHPRHSSRARPPPPRGRAEARKPAGAGKAVGARLIWSSLRPARQ